MLVDGVVDVIQRDVRAEGSKTPPGAGLRVHLPREHPRASRHHSGWLPLSPLIVNGMDTPSYMTCAISPSTA